ncbi:hypothetical protein CLV30_11736 [Haloactinopolyspora alba]|uniref:Uncharacterized protein n=2 Tax=Haloactinopolyspora alba TaxID=648780 RepID=A0A2P8DR90_9ACTN|nr:hypothetical protein CLV30_11736 [Haloactinopolyspora alba]
MGWRWQFVAADGGPVQGVDDGAGRPEAGFPTQSDAESWLGEHWRELAEAGVDAVILRQDDREVYGPMSLNPPE